MITGLIVVSKIAYTPVLPRHSAIAVVGTGSSLDNVNLEFGDKVTVIAVNSAIHLLNCVDYWFTLDTSSRNRLIMRRPISGITYYAAVPIDYGQPNARVAAMRRPAEQHVNYLERVCGDGHGRLKTKGGLPKNKKVIHTGNSGWGAFQLACHMEPRKIGLFGLDGYGNYAKFGGKPTHLYPMPDLFRSALPDLQERGIKVVNASINSVIDCFEKRTIEDTARWLMDP